VRAGKCYRLCTEEVFKGQLSDMTIPEMPLLPPFSCCVHACVGPRVWEQAEWEHAEQLVPRAISVDGKGCLGWCQGLSRKAISPGAPMRACVYSVRCAPHAGFERMGLHSLHSHARTQPSS
jgi:hypothetical protein